MRLLSRSARAVMGIMLVLAVATACRSSATTDQARVAVSPTATATPAITAVPTIATPRVAPTPEPTPTPTPTAAPVPPPRAVAAVPVRVRIPKIGVNALISPVGVDATGAMDTPNDAWTVGWYSPGARPANPGNAVLAGHVDYVRVGPAVFYSLRALVPGDRVFVNDAAGQEHEFVVTEIARYTPATAPLERIFGWKETPGLNLITCDGTFDARTHEYDQRVVVYTESVTWKSQ